MSDVSLIWRDPDPVHATIPSLDQAVVTECCNCGIVDERGKTDAGSAGTQPARDTLAEASK